jgi:hypothetical protein
MSLSPAGNIPAPDSAPGGRAAADPGRAVQARPTVALVVDERVVDVHIRTLRRGLGDDAAHPSIIETVRSVGYRFLPPPA